MNGNEQYLLNRQQAAERYGMSVRGLEDMYRQHPDFPIVRLGRKVLIHREAADRWFDSFLGGVIERE